MSVWQGLLPHTLMTAPFGERKGSKQQRVAPAVNVLRLVALEAFAPRSQREAASSARAVPFATLGKAGPLSRHAAAPGPDQLPDWRCAGLLVSVNRGRLPRMDQFTAKNYFSEAHCRKSTIGPVQPGADERSEVRAAVLIQRRAEAARTT